MKNQYGSYFQLHKWINKFKFSSLLMIGLLYGISISIYATTTYPFEGRWTTGNSDDCSDPVEFTSAYMRYGIYDVFYLKVRHFGANEWRIETDCSVGVFGDNRVHSESEDLISLEESNGCKALFDISIENDVLTHNVLYFSKYVEFYDNSIKYHRCSASDKKEVIQTTEQNQLNSSSIKLDESVSVLFNSKIINKPNQNILLKDKLSKNINNGEIFTIDINKKITNNNYHKNLVTKLNKLEERLISFRFLAQPYNQCFNFDEYQLHQLMEQKYVI